MNYDDHDAGAPAVDAQESADEAAASAQVEHDQAQAEAVPF